MELLAPAGDEDALRAAVQNGADAVYLGTGSFNARRHAGNFDGDELKAAVDYCHVRNVKVHVTLNTLVREDELDALEDTIESIVLSGADAVIVQDFGIVRALSQMAPGLDLHASTQMAVHNRQGAAFLKAQGFSRAVLARELTFGEMAQCAAEGIDIEAFVHGALCVACSGQCLMSSLVGGRSGNRGLCAQPCRLPWRLDGRSGYLLSTRDLCGIDLLARYQAAGVRSLKIEGRLKRAEYVAQTVSAYRRALDALYAHRENPEAEADRQGLLQMFNRGGFTRGYGPGMAEEDLMDPRRPNHMGMQVGRCERDGSVRLLERVEPADALALRRGVGEDVPVKLSGAAGESARCPQARRGDGLFRMVSEAQMRAARASFEGERRRIPVTMRAVLRVGSPARLTVSDGTVTAEASGEVIQPATGRGLDEERAAAQLRKTGGTPYEITDIRLDADAGAFCPASMLNALRRDALGALERLRLPATREVRPLARPQAPGVASEKPLLLAQCDDLSALVRALGAGADAAVFSPSDVRPEALARVNLESLAGPDRVGLALPAVLSAEDLKCLHGWAAERRASIGMTFLSNVGQLGLDWPGETVGDYLLNAGSLLSAEQLEAWGVDAITPSVELTAAQIARLGGAPFLVMWGRLPLMHLRHCPLRAAEGAAGRHADCRRCDGEKGLAGKALVDRRNAAFPLRRVAQQGGCVIQVLNSAALMPLRRLDRIPAARGWRLLLQADEPVEAIVRVYRAALDGGDYKALLEWERIEEMNTTTGHYFRGVE